MITSIDDFYQLHSGSFATLQGDELNAKLPADARRTTFFSADHRCSKQRLASPETEYFASARSKI